MAVRAVFFDMGGTIETFWYTREMRLQATEGIQQRLSEAGIDLHLDVEQLFEVISAGLERYHQKRLRDLNELPTQQIWSEFILSGFAVDQGRLADIAEDLMVYIEANYYRREMRPEMPAVLAAIREMGLKIGLISNVCSRGLVPQNLERYGIRSYFDPVVLSSEYGRRKPDPSIFHCAARLANVPTGKCLYVGDRIARDIIGARKAGFKYAVQINHGFNHGEDDTGAIPDAIMRSMDELIGFLAAVNQEQPGSGNDCVCPPALSGGGQTQSAGLRAILFDAADVLYYLPNKGKKLARFLAGLGIHYSNHSTEDNKALADQAFVGSITLDQYREMQLRNLGVTSPQDIERGKQILEEETEDIAFFEGVGETLLALKQQGLMLGIITDTSLPVYIKLNWFDRGGFGCVWDSVISSKEVGFRKPSPEIYQAALSQLGLSGQQAAFVGHKKSELDGAHAVGLKTIAFNYDDDACADVYIEKFSDLLNLSL
jgi:putative hydrolase of the HAD superfamily